MFGLGTVLQIFHLRLLAGPRGSDKNPEGVQLAPLEPGTVVDGSV